MVCALISRGFAQAQVSCMLDLSVLPGNAPYLLTAPTATTPSFIAVSLGFSVVFFFLFASISLRGKLGARLSAALERPSLERASAWIGLLGFMIGRIASILEIFHLRYE